jgi:hypothetical protein
VTIDDIIAQITAEAPSFNTVTKVDVSAGAVDSAKELVSALSATFSARIYPLTLPEDPTHPSVVYEMVTTPRIHLDGIDIAQRHVYVLSIRADTFSEMITKVDATRTALAASAWSIEISDMLSGYDDEQQHYRTDLEIIFSYASFAPLAADLPAVLVFEESQKANESVLDNCIKQRVATDFSYIIATDSSDMDSLRSELMTALLGFQSDPSEEDTQYRQGVRIPSTGNLSLWRETYFYRHWIKEA